MKIKVILTGGTVGSEKVNGVVKNNKDSNIALMWKEKFNSNIVVVSNSKDYDNLKMIEKRVSKVIINEELEHNKIYNVQIDRVDGINVYGSVVRDK